MKIAFQCPTCSQVYEVDASHAGRAARCACSAMFRVPTPPEEDEIVGAAASAVLPEPEAAVLESTTPVDALDTDFDAEEPEADTGAFDAVDDGDLDADLDNGAEVDEGFDDDLDADDEEDTGRAAPVEELEDIDEVEDLDEVDDLDGDEIDDGDDVDDLGADFDDDGDEKEDDTGAFDALEKEDETGDDLDAEKADDEDDADDFDDEDDEAVKEDKPEDDEEEDGVALVVPQSWPGRILLLVALALFGAALFLPVLKGAAASVLFPEGKSYRVQPMHATELNARDILPTSDLDFSGDDWGSELDSSGTTESGDASSSEASSWLEEDGSDSDSDDYEDGDEPAGSGSMMTPGLPGASAPVTPLPEGAGAADPILDEAPEASVADPVTEAEGGSVTGLELVLQSGAKSPLSFAVLAGIGLTLILLVLSFLGVRLSMVGGLVLTVLAAGAVGAGLFGVTMLETAAAFESPMFLIDEAEIGMFLMLGGLVAVLAGGVICSVGVFGGAKPTSTPAGGTKGGRGTSRGGARAGGGKKDAAKPARGGARKPLAKPATKGAVKPALPGKKLGAKPVLPAGKKPVGKPAIPGKKPAAIKPGVKKGVSTKAIKPPARKR